MVESSGVFVAPEMAKDALLRSHYIMRLTVEQKQLLIAKGGVRWIRGLLQAELDAAPD